MAQYERQHYIPQFLIRYFADKDGYVSYVDKKTNKESFQKTEDIFYYKNLYDDSKNRSGIKQTEINFAKQENEAKRIIDKLQNGREVILLKSEYAKLILFLHILSFRNKKGLDDMRRHKNDEKVIDGLKTISQEIESVDEAWRILLNDYSNMQNLEDLNDFHKASRSARMQLKYIISNYHVNVFECKEGSLVLSDILSVAQQDETIFGPIPAIMCFPISRSRLLVMSRNDLASNNKLKTSIPVNKLDIPYSNDTSMKIRISTIYKKQIDVLNDALIKYCTEGYII